ncbi:MAG TPA: rod shape-determining protein RodA, partial [Holosporales bacterium]|nr:rod shape-determining protein RodA [Holosporales bacterium]
MKVTLIMALAHYFHDKSPLEISRLKTYFWPLVLVALPCVLVLRQPDLGTMLILAATGAVVIFMAGIQMWKVVTVLGLVGASLPALWFNMHAYQKKRVMTFLNPENDPLGSGYHIMQSKISIGSGGFWGKGFLQGTQSQLQFLPEKQTDFIFAHFSEEFGVFGGSLLILLYGLIIATALKVTFECRSYYARLYGIGFTALFFFYVFINIGMVMGLLPVVGVPLPFMSYGGTSMISLLMGFGILFSASVHRHLRFGRSYNQNY